jgi:hypothetical protein
VQTSKAGFHEISAKGAVAKEQVTEEVSTLIDGGNFDLNITLEKLLTGHVEGKVTDRGGGIQVFNGGVTGLIAREIGTVNTLGHDALEDEADHEVLRGNEKLHTRASENILNDSVDLTSTLESGEEGSRLGLVLLSEVIDVGQSNAALGAVDTLVALLGLLLRDDQGLEVSGARLVSTVGDDGSEAVLDKIDGNVLVLEVDRPERLGRKLLRRVLGSERRTLVVEDTAHSLANKLLAEELLTHLGNLGVAASLLALLLLGVRKLLLLLGVIVRATHEARDGHRGQGDFTVNFRITLADANGNGVGIDDLNDLSGEVLSSVGRLGTLALLGGRSSLVVLPDAELAILGNLLSLLEVRKLHRGRGRPLNDLGETHTKEVDADVAALLIKDSTEEVEVLVDTLDGDRHIAVEEEVLGDELSLTRERLGVGIIGLAEVGGTQTSEEEEEGVTRLREVNAEGGATADALDNSIKGLVLHLLKEVEEIIGALATVRLAVLHVANGTAGVGVPDSNLLVLGLLAEGLEGKVLLRGIAAFTLANDDIRPALLNDSETDVGLVEPDLTVSALSSLVLNTVDNRLADELLAKILTGVPGEGFVLLKDGLTVLHVLLTKERRFQAEESELNLLGRAAHHLLLNIKEGHGVTRRNGTHNSRATLVALAVHVVRHSRKVSMAGVVVT